MRTFQLVRIIRLARLWRIEASSYVLEHVEKTLHFAFVLKFVTPTSQAIIQLISNNIRCLAIH